MANSLLRHLLEEVFDELLESIQWAHQLMDRAFTCEVRFVVSQYRYPEPL